MRKMMLKFSACCLLLLAGWSSLLALGPLDRSWWVLPPWQLFNSATPIIHNCKDCFKLTDDVPGQKGCIWDSDMVDFNAPIDIQVTLNFGDKDGNGADGICLVFAPVPGCGETGQGIGAAGIPNSIIIEFDTWNNGAGGGDIPGDHVALNINGDVTNPIFGPTDLGNIEDGQDHTMRFFWDGAGNFEVYFDGVLVLSGSYDLIGVMGSSQVFMGFTASTGGATNTHIVCPDNTPPPVPAPPVFTQFDLEVCEGEQGVVYAVLPVPNVTYIWTVPPGASPSGSGAGITIGWGSTGGDVCVKIDDGCNESDTVCVTVEVIPLPQVSFQDPGVLCQESFNLFDLILVNLEPGHQVTYHPTQVAAQQGTPDLGSPPIVQQSGTYWLRIEAGDGCVQIVPVPLILELPEIVVEQPAPVCAPATLELSLVGVLDVNGLPLVLFTYFLSEFDAENNLNPLVNTAVSTSGTYWVRAETANGCWAVASIEVVIVPPPVLLVDAPPPFCNVGIFDLWLLDIMEANGLDPSQYTIQFYLTEADALNGFPSLDPAVVTTSGTYWVRMTNVAGCSDVAGVEIQFFESPQVWILAPDAVCAGAPFTLTFVMTGNPDFAVNYEAGGTPYSFTTASSTQEETLSLQASSTILITSFSDQTPPDCPVQLPPPLFIDVWETISISPPLWTCDGTQYTVSFSLLTGDSLSWVVEGLSGLQAGGYFQSDSYPSGTPFTLQVWDANGCDTLLFSATPDCSCETDAGTFTELSAQLCRTDTLFLTFAGNGFLDPDDIREYILYTGTPFSISTILQRGATPVFVFDPSQMTTGTTYYAAPVAGNGLGGIVDPDDPCFSLVKGIPVVFHEWPSYPLPPDDTICAGLAYTLSFPLTGTPPFEITYQIAGQAPVVQQINGNVFSLPLPTTQSVSVVFHQLQDAYCLSDMKDTFFLQVNTGPTVSNFVFNCNGTNTEFTIQFTITGGDPATYQVQGGAGTLNGNVFVSDPMPAGSAYAFVVTDAFGCKPYTVSGSYDCLCQSKAGSIAGGPFRLCLGDSLAFKVNGSFLDGNDTMVWWLITDPLNPVASRVYSLKGKMLYYPGAPLLPDSTYFLIAAVGNSGAYFGLDTADICLDFSVPIPVRFISSPQLLAITPSPAAIFSCQDTLLTLQATVAGSPNLQWEWLTTGGTILTPVNQPTIQVGAPGWYTVVAREPLAGCLDSLGIFLGQSTDVPVIILPPPSVLDCTRDTVVLNATASGAGGNLVYSWTTANGQLVAGQSMPLATVNAPGTYVLTLTDTNSQCKATATVEVFQNIIPPSAQAGADVFVPCGQDLPLLSGEASSGQGNLSYMWSALEGALSGNGVGTQVQVQSAGTYLLVVTDSANGCTAADTVRVAWGADLELGALEVADPRCFEEATGQIAVGLPVGGSAPFTGILAGLSQVLPASWTGLKAGVYTLRLTDAQGCVKDTLLILINPAPLQLELGPDRELRLGESTVIVPQIQGGNGGIAQRNWEAAGAMVCPGCPELVYAPQQTTTIRLEIVDDRGCKASDALILRVRVPREVYIPTAFSPNNDGINDVFAIYGGEAVAGVREMAVFDRWGNALYLQRGFAADGTTGWDGRYRNQPMDPGVYVWYAELLFVDGVVQLVKGEVHLLR